MCLTYAIHFYCTVIYCHRLRGNTFSPFSIISAQHQVSIIYAFYYRQSLQSMQLTVVVVCARGWLIPYHSTGAFSDYIYDREGENVSETICFVLVEILTQNNLDECHLLSMRTIFSSCHLITIDALSKFVLNEGSIDRKESKLIFVLSDF